MTSKPHRTPGDGSDRGAVERTRQNPGGNGLDGPSNQHISLADDFQTVREGLVRDGHDRFAALRRIEEQFDALRETVAEARDALWWIVDNRADAGGAAAMILKAYGLLDGVQNPATRPDA